MKMKKFIFRDKLLTFVLAFAAFSFWVSQFLPLESKKNDVTIVITSNIFNSHFLFFPSLRTLDIHQNELADSMITEDGHQS